MLFSLTFLFENNITFIILEEDGIKVYRTSEVKVLSWNTFGSHVRIPRQTWAKKNR